MSLKHFVPSFAVLLALLFDTSGAAADSPVGIVLRADCRGHRCQVTRGVAVLLVQPLMPLYIGDIVAAGGGRIVIVTSDKRKIDLSNQNPRVTIGEPKGSDGMLARFASNIASEFSPQSFSDSSASARLASIEPPAALELCFHHPANMDLKIAAGMRPIVIATRGGIGPLQLQVPTTTGQRSQPIGASAMTMPVSQVMELVPGKRTIEIHDVGAGTMLPLPLNIMGRSDVPVMPDSMKLSTLTPHDAAILRLAWLANQDGGIWSIEALAEAAELPFEAPAPDEFLQGCQSSQ